MNQTPIPYTAQYYISFAVALLLAVAGAMQVAAQALGLTPAQIAWLGVATAALGVVGTLGLPRAASPPALHEERKAALEREQADQIVKGG